MAHTKAETLDTERNEARLNFRTKPSIKRAIQQAAALSGMDETTFAVSAAFKAAQETLAAFETTQLSKVDQAMFLQALDRADPPTQALKQAFDRHSAFVKD